MKNAFWFFFLNQFFSQAKPSSARNSGHNDFDDTEDLQLFRREAFMFAILGGTHEPPFFGVCLQVFKEKYNYNNNNISNNNKKNYDFILKL